MLRESDASLRIVYLRVDRDDLFARLIERHGHFFPATLLESQFADLEEPSADEHAIVVSASGSPQETVAKILSTLPR